MRHPGASPEAQGTAALRAATSEPSGPSRVVAALRNTGVPIRRIWVDEWHPQTMRTTFSMRRRGLGWKDIDVPVYPRVFRWQLKDGSGGSVLLNPIIVPDGRYEREDHIAQAQELFRLIRAHYSGNASRGETHPQGPSQ